MPVVYTVGVLAHLPGVWYGPYGKCARNPPLYKLLYHIHGSELHMISYFAFIHWLQREQCNPILICHCRVSFFTFWDSTWSAEYSFLYLDLLAVKGSGRGIHTLQTMKLHMYAKFDWQHPHVQPYLNTLTFNHISYHPLCSIISHNTFMFNHIS